MLSFKPTFSAGYMLSFYWGPSYEPRDLPEESANKLSFISCSHVFISPQFATFGSLKLCALFCHFSIICCFVKRLCKLESKHSSLSYFSFRIDWFDFLAVLETLKSLLQHFSPKASILQHSAFFIVQLSHPYMTTGKTIAFTRQTFVGKVMFLLFNILSRLVITFLPRSKHLLISWLQSPSAVILEPPKIKSDTVSIVSPSICHEVMGPDAMILGF